MIKDKKSNLAPNLLTSAATALCTNWSQPRLCVLSAAFCDRQSSELTWLIFLIRHLRFFERPSVSSAKNKSSHVSARKDSLQRDCVRGVGVSVAEFLLAIKCVLLMADQCVLSQKFSGIKANSAGPHDVTGVFV